MPLPYRVGAFLFALTHDKAMLTLKDLTAAQLGFLQETAALRGETVDQYLLDLSPDPFLKDAIQGVLPHCGLWGLMESDGRCHT